MPPAAASPLPTTFLLPLPHIHAQNTISIELFIGIEQLISTYNGLDPVGGLRFAGKVPAAHCFPQLLKQDDAPSSPYA